MKTFIAGVDRVTVGDLAGTGIDTVHADLSSINGVGDGAADTVIGTGTSTVDRVTFGSPTPGETLLTGLAAAIDVTGGEPDTDVVRAETFGGADVITSKPGLSGPVAAADGGDGSDTARFLGSGYDDTIGIAQSSPASVRTFDAGSAGLDTTAVENLAVVAGDGNDTVSGQNGIGALTHMTIDGGEGDDTLGGGDGDDTLLGGNGNDHLDGNRGADVARLGNGDDVSQWDPGDGSDTVDGQVGYDRLDFNGSNAGERISVSRNGSRTRLSRDVGAVTQDIDTIEAVRVRALGGTDDITVGDLSNTGIDSAGVDLTSSAGTPDGAADTVTVNGTNRPDAVAVTRSADAALVGGLPAQTSISGGEGALDTLRVNTLGGDDDVIVAPDVKDLLTTIVDLGVDG